MISISESCPSATPRPTQRVGHFTTQFSLKYPLNVASAIGTREAILGALEGLNTKYGPAFSLMAGEWRALDYCGDSKLASYNNALASELSSLGFAFTTLKADDNAALVEAAGNMNKITDISDDLAAYIGQQ